MRRDIVAVFDADGSRPGLPAATVAYCAEIDGTLECNGDAVMDRYRAAYETLVGA